jgi:hypothetical protein
MNLFGIDVSSLDVAAFERTTRLLYPFLALAFLALVWRQRSARLLLVGVLLANAWLFVATQWPLQRLYGLGTSRDRVNNVGLALVVAAGNSPLETAQPGQLHFEPFWGLLLAVLSGFDPERLLRLYAFMPLVALTLFGLALYHGLRAPPGEGVAMSPFERALVAGFVTLLCSSPLDAASSYRVTWALMFLLKPNHALGLVLLPLVLRAFAGMRSLRARIGVGVLLQLMGWAFVIHMGLTAIGLVVYALASLLLRRDQARRDVLDVLIVLGVNLLIVSPYLYMLMVDFPFTTPGAHATIPPWSPHLLEVTWRTGWLLPVAAWGTWCLWRRGDRLGRLWAAQVVAGLMSWAACLVLSEWRLAREMDEFYQWCRFTGALAAAVGAWDLLGRVAQQVAQGAAQLGDSGHARLAALARRVTHEPAARAVLLALLVLPASVPYWYDAATMDPFFEGSCRPLPALVTGPTDFLRRQTGPRDVVAGDREFATWVSALGARRVLVSARLNTPRDASARNAAERALLRGDDAAARRGAFERFGVRWLVVTPALLEQHGTDLATLRQRADLQETHLTREGAQRFVAIFRVLPSAP